jgi:hypothetical protein
MDILEIFARIESADAARDPAFDARRLGCRRPFTTPRPPVSGVALFVRQHKVLGQVVACMRRGGDCPQLVTRCSRATWRWLCLPAGAPTAPETN